MSNNIEKLKLEGLNRKSIEEFKESEKIPVCLLLDDIRSMHNVGSIFRTSDAFSLEKIYLCGITAKPPHREIQKTALGATESVDWEYVESIETLIKELKSKYYCILGIEQVKDSVLLNDFKIDTTKKYALILGNEVEGIKEDVLSLIDIFVEIPQTGTKHSLNVSVCTGIVVWECFRGFFEK